METKEVFDASTYPEDDEYVIYYFEPFKRWCTGRFDKEYISVYGLHGFTSWHPEVTMWMKGE